MIRLALYVSYYLLNLLTDVDAVAVIGTLPLALVCCWNVARIRSKYFTVSDMFWFLMYIFFAIGPLQALRNGYFDHGGPADGYPILNSEILTACAIPLIFSLFVTILGYLPRTHVSEERRFTVSVRYAPLLAAAMLVFFAAFIVTSGGFTNAFAPRYLKAYEETSFLSVVCFGAQVVIAAIYTTIGFGKPLARRHLVVYYPLLVLVLALLLLTANPINSARYFLVAAWMPIGFIVLKGRVGSIQVYSFLSFALLILMPLLSISTREGTFSLANIDFSHLDDSMFRIPFLDVFDMMVYEVNYVSRSGFYWGGKTLGVLFFFVPRAIWAGKETLLAIDMGQELVGMRLAGTDNLSLFFGGEFYADGGLAGVALGSAAVILWLYRFAIPRAITINGINMSALVLMAALPILLRGPIGANLPLTVSEYVILALITTVLGRKAKPARATVRARLDEFRAWRQRRAQPLRHKQSS